MYLIELLLPVYDNEGRRFTADAFAAVRRTLVDTFGGVTAHVQAPAVGLWENPEGGVTRDEVVIFEVMTDSLDRAWWSAYRTRLQHDFPQQEIVLRATPVEKL